MRIFIPKNVGITDDTIFQLIQTYCASTNNTPPVQSVEELTDEFCQRFATEIYDFSDYLTCEGNEVTHQIIHQLTGSFLMKDFYRKLDESGVLIPHDDSYIKYHEKPSRSKVRPENMAVAG
jgi:hypothetical protein